MSATTAQQARAAYARRKLTPKQRKRARKHANRTGTFGRAYSQVRG